LICDGSYSAKIGNFSKWGEIHEFIDLCARNIGILSGKERAHTELQEKLVMAGCQGECKVSTDFQSRLDRGSIDVVYRGGVAIELAFSSIDEIFRDLWRFEYLYSKQQLEAGLIIMPSGPVGCFKNLPGPFVRDGAAVTEKLAPLLKCPVALLGVC